MKKLAFFLGKLLVSVSLLYLVFRRVDGGAVLAMFRRVDWWFAGAACVLCLGGLVLGASRWMVLLPQGEAASRPSFPLLLRQYFVGHFYNTLLPGGFGGDIVRGVISKQHAGTLASAMAAVILERIVGLLGIIAVAFVSAALCGPLLVRSGLLPVAVFGAVAIVLGTVGLIGSLHLLARASWPNWLIQRGPPRIARLAIAVDEYRERRGAVLLSLLVTVAIQLIMVAAVYAIAKGIAAPVGLVDCLLIVPLIQLVSCIPISISGLGIREAAFVVLLGQLGVPEGQSLGVSLFFFAIMVGLAIVGGAIHVLPQEAIDSRRQAPRAPVE